jgi:membrane fusion protein (multidrug efflux system)
MQEKLANKSSPRPSEAKSGAPQDKRAQQDKTAAKTAAPTDEKPARDLRPLAIALAVALVAIGGAYYYWQEALLYPSTDNAYVQANVVRIAPLVAGPVTEVDVGDNQHVDVGAVLFKIDPTPYQAALDAAKAGLLLAQKSGAQPTIDQAQAAVTKAQLDLDRTTVKAPVEGTVAEVRVRPGTVVQAGAALFALVDTSSWWLDANFKETDLERIAAGQKARVIVDLYPSHEFKGEVDSISPASGTAFSILPPQNATGNWVKVTQRIPVRISIKTAKGDPELRVGASASVTVDTTSKAAAP